jgi:hypothetical protein
MGELGASFVFTGEVLGQRPMSQRLRALSMVETDGELPGLVVRPLSAKLLQPTIPEKQGWIKRDQLYDISGRGRQRQMGLARQLGFKSWANPAGGCLLTDGNYAKKFRDLVAHTEDPLHNLTRDDYAMLLVGRHKRLNERVSFVIGRDQRENDTLIRMAKDRWLVDGDEVIMGPTTLVKGDASDADLARIAAITAGFGKARGEESVTMRAYRGGEQKMLRVKPESGDSVVALSIC